MKSVIVLSVVLIGGSTWAQAPIQIAAPGVTATQPAVAAPQSILTPEAQLARARELVERFVRHVEASPALSEAARQTVAQAWSAHRADDWSSESEGDRPEDFLWAGLAIVSEPFKNALAALDREEHETADAALRTLLEDADPYLSLHAAGLLARSLVEQDRLEEAEPMLVALAARDEELDRLSFLACEVDFLLGYCQLSNLRYAEALATLRRFEERHPDAPDKFRLPARQMLQELAAHEPESLGEVSDLMVYAGRRLAGGVTDESVQGRQQRAVELLEKLIKEAEDSEQQGGGGGGGSRAGRGGPPRGAGGSPADVSALPGGRGTKGPLNQAPTARPGEMWGQMRPEERERILQSLRERFPSRYRQLVEQYYRQLAKEP